MKEDQKQFATEGTESTEDTEKGCRGGFVLGPSPMMLVGGEPVLMRPITVNGEKIADIKPRIEMIVNDHPASEEMRAYFLAALKKQPQLAIIHDASPVEILPLSAPKLEFRMSGRNYGRSLLHDAFFAKEYSDQMIKAHEKGKERFKIYSTPRGGGKRSFLEMLFLPNEVLFDHDLGMTRKYLWAKYPQLTRAQIRKIIS